METFTTKPVGELQPNERTAIAALLDSTDCGSAYQYPYAGDAGELFFLLERDGQLCFSGRAGTGYFASRWLSFLRVLSFNRGPVAASQQDLVLGLHKVKEWARSKGYMAVSVSPEIEWCHSEPLALALGEAGLVKQGIGKRYTLRLDLTAAEADLMAGFPKDCRYRIRRAEKEGIVIRYGAGDEDLHAFIAVHRQMTGRKGLAEAPLRLLQALWQLRSQDPTRLALVMAEYEGQLLGANIVFRSGRRAEYLFGAVGKAPAVLHGDVTAGYPLQWGGMLWAKATGCVDYDMGGYSPVTLTGPARLKKGFFQTVTPVELCGQLNMDLRPVLAPAVRTLRRVALAALSDK